MKLSLLLAPLLVVVTVAGVIVGLTRTHGQQPAQAEKEKLRGDWIIVSAECRGAVAQIFGQVPEPEKIKTVNFSGDRMRLSIDGRSTPATYHLDPTTVPKNLDLTFRVGGNKEATFQGIYDLDGDNLALCFDSFAEERPAGFPPKVKDPDEIRLARSAVLVLRRIGADPGLDALDRNKANCARDLGTLLRIMQDQALEEQRYPPAAIYSKDGVPLLSWRVALLARMDQDQLLKEFKTDEPWDSAHNKTLIAKMPRLYALPGVETKEPGMTFYRVFTGEGTVFEGKDGLKFTNHLRGGDPHFMIVEAGEPVPWTKPDELAYDPRKPLPRLGRLSDEGFFATSTSYGPDRVRFIPKSTAEDKLRSMIQWRAVDGKENQDAKTP
jgi:uncharacterized protein (TIGR03067 family)